MPEINANAGSGDCTWVASLATNNPSISHNATFDLRPLRVTDPNALSYHVTNGDSITSLHPHTRDYSFAWNLCAPVTGTFKFKMLFSTLLTSYVMWSGALDSSDVLLLYSKISLA